MHLKVIQEMAKVPRGPGLPPLNDAAFNEALIVGSSAASTSSAVSTQSPLPLLPMSDDDPRINPLAGLGLSDEQYAQILQTLVTSDTFSGFDNGSGSRAASGSGSGSGGAGEGSAGGGGGGGLTKRGLEDAEGDPRDEKRSRFQVVE